MNYRALLYLLVTLLALAGMFFSCLMVNAMIAWGLHDQGKVIVWLAIVVNTGISGVGWTNTILWAHGLTYPEKRTTQ